MKFINGIMLVEEGGLMLDVRSVNEVMVDMSLLVRGDVRKCRNLDRSLSNKGQSYKQ
ncbi:MAG: hypothetical protein K0R78_3474 [Pelosinus sp.]|nr:hypothetical protein [Pelosinus sp.]